MKHSIEWQDDATNAAPEERATVADLRLELNRQNVTKHIVGEQVSDHVTIALYGLANGLAHDWWTIFGARDREFSLRKYRSGYLLPDVRFAFDGAAFEVSAHQCAYVDPDLRFWGGTAEVLSRADGEAWLESLIGDVLARLDAKGVQDTSAVLRWRRVNASRHSRDRDFCEAAGGLGLDPYAITAAVANFIEQAEGLFDHEPLVEFVSGADDVDQERLVNWVSRMVGLKGFKYRLADLRPLVDTIERDTPRHDDAPAWAAGYRRARAMRRQLNVTQNERLSSFQQIARLFGASKNYSLAPSVDGINALRRETPNGIDVHVRNHGHYDGADIPNRFALARAIGDAACFPSPDTAPINRLRHAYRQAAGRAFAAEFLAPIDEILSMRADEHDTYSIAAEMGVSSQVIEHQLENQTRIETACKD